MEPASFGNGRFRVAHALGEGGMAVVYRAWDGKLSAWRAIKTILPEYATKKGLRDRFLREARAMAALEHPNIVRVYDVVDEGDQPFIVMELVEGGSLEDWVERNGKMPPRLAVDALIEASAGVQAAHDKGVIHRDLKPGNVLIGLDGRCRIADFGIAQIDGGTQSKKTKTGMMMGTLGYMAPEQSVDAKRADARADVYALGATFLHLVHGEPPVNMFPAVTPELYDALPAPLAAVIKKATALKTDDRYASVNAFVDALRGVRDGLPGVAAAPLPAAAKAAPPIPPEVAASATPVKPMPAIPAPKAGAAPTLMPEVGGSSATPVGAGPTAVPDHDHAEKLRKLQAKAYGAQPVPARPSAAPPIVGTSDKPYEVVDDDNTGLRPEYIDLTDEEKRLAELLRNKQGEDDEEEQSAQQKAINSASGIAKDGAEFLVQIAVALLKFFFGPGLIIVIPVSLLVSGALVKMTSANSEMAEIQTRVVDQRKSFLEAMLADPKLPSDVISIGGSRVIITRAEKKLKDAKTDAEKGAAASDLVHLLRLQFDKLPKELGDPEEVEIVKKIDDRIRKLEKACDQYDIERFGLAEICDSYTGQMVSAFGFGPCAELGE